jgi:hypothetical protein
MFIHLSAEGFLALRRGFWVVFVLYWVGMGLLVGYLEGRYFVNVRTAAGLVVMALACFGSSVASFAIIFSSTIRKLVTDPHRFHHYEPICFGFAGVIFIFIGVGALLSMPWQSGAFP